MQTQDNPPPLTAYIKGPILFSGQVAALYSLHTLKCVIDLYVSSARFPIQHVFVRAL